MWLLSMSGHRFWLASALTHIECLQMADWFTNSMVTGLQSNEPCSALPISFPIYSYGWFELQHCALSSATAGR